MNKINKHRRIIPIFIPHLGCPNNCIFCNQKAISGETEIPDEKYVNKVINDFLLSADGYTDELAFFGGSFTAIPLDDMVRYLEYAVPYLKSGKIGGIRISTRPDAINDVILDILEKYGVKIIELGAQSMRNTVLDMSRRGHTVEDTINASELIKKRGFTLGLQTMIGLPGSTHEDELYTAHAIAALKPAMVRIYPLLVLKNTELAEMYKRNLYVPFSDDTVVEILSEVMSVYNDHDIDIIRVGLQSAERMSDEESVVAGTLLPSLKQEAQAYEIRKAVDEYIKKCADVDVKGIMLYSEEKYSTAVMGKNKANFFYWREKHEKLKVGYRDIAVADCPATVKIYIKTIKDYIYLEVKSAT